MEQQRKKARISKQKANWSKTSSKSLEVLMNKQRDIPREIGIPMTVS